MRALFRNFIVYAWERNEGGYFFRIDIFIWKAPSFSLCGHSSETLLFMRGRETREGIFSELTFYLESPLLFVMRALFRNFIVYAWERNEGGYFFRIDILSGKPPPFRYAGTLPKLYCLCVGEKRGRVFFPN